MPDAIISEPIAGIGHNNPPLTRFEKAQKRILDLYEEAKLWFDGAEITSQDQADGVNNILTWIREAHNEADAAREEENEPFNTGKAEVQARYAPLIADTTKVRGKTILVAECCKRVLQPWLDKEKARLAAETEAAQKLADEALAAAQTAFRGSDPANLADRERAEQLGTEAASAAVTAKRAGKATPKAGTVGRASGLRTRYVPTMTNPVLALRHFYSICPEDFKALAQKKAEEICRAGQHAKDELPGFEISTKTYV